MIRSAVDTIIQSRLGNRTGLTTWIHSEMDLIQTNILERKEPLPWFLLKSATLTTTALIPASIAVPTDFIREHENCGLWLQNSDGTETLLSKDEYEVLNSSDYLADLEGDPVGYSLLGDTVYFFPKPLTPISAKMFYYAHAVLAVADSSETLWLKNAPDVVIGEVGIQIARFLRDERAVALFDADRQRGWKSLEILSTSRQAAAMHQALGEG